MLISPHQVRRTTCPENNHMKQARPLFLLFILCLLWGASGCGTEPPPPTAAPPPTPTADVGQLATPLPRDELTALVPLLAERSAAFSAALTAEPPVLRLPNGVLDDIGRYAETIALADPTFTQFVRDTATGQPLRNEIMEVRPALPSDISEQPFTCEPEPCYRVEMYHYATSLTSLALVDVNTEQVLLATTQSNLQPEIPAHLTELATQIAIHSPEVIIALGGRPGAGEAVMPNVKTALNGTRCERSQHLCVAPTFLADGRALWAIVDLTDEKLVGVRWTNLGQTNSPTVVTERSLQNDFVWQNFCQQSHTLTRDGWQMSYMLTSSDGLKVSDVRYQERLVLRSAKVVDWHVSYSQQDGFGYSDAMGCPLFSTAAVVAFNGPEVEEIWQDGQPVGFALSQDFRSPIWPAACNYRYMNRFEFYTDGRFRVVAINLGRGCGDNGTYRPVIRLDVQASGDSAADNLAEWNGREWATWTQERWQLIDENPANYTPEGYRYRLSGVDGTGYYLEPGRGQFPHGERGDNAYIYVTRYVAGRDEGASDLPTIGSCCNTDHRQGPEQFLAPPEPIANTDLVIWYVAQMANDSTPGQEHCWADTVIVNGLPVAQSWPCAAGPLFVPIP